MAEYTVSVEKAQKIINLVDILQKENSVLQDKIKLAVDREKVLKQQIATFIQENYANKLSPSVKFVVEIMQACLQVEPHYNIAKLDELAVSYVPMWDYEKKDWSFLPNYVADGVTYGVSTPVNLSKVILILKDRGVKPPLTQ
jgi:hypothetical protein